MKPGSFFTGRAPMIVAAVVGAILAAVAWRAFEAARLARDRQAETTARFVTIEQTMQRERAALTGAEESHRRRERENAPLPSPAAKPALSVEAQKSQRQQARLRDPKVQLARQAVERAHFATRFDPFYRAAGLTAEQRAAFEDLMSRYNTDLKDIEAAIEAQGVSSFETAFGNLYAPLREKLDRARDEAQRTLLGDQVFARWQEYERTEGVRGVIAEMVGAASMQGVAIEGRQAEQLVPLIAQASRTYREGFIASSLNVDWAAFDAQASKVLTERQAAVFGIVEPQGGAGGRYWAQLCKALSDAVRDDTEAEEAAAEKAAKRPGS